MAVNDSDKPGRRTNQLGPTGMQVASNLARIRTGQGLSTTALAHRLTERGRPMVPTAITKIEKGTRRVDVDDLVALAAALGVNPSALLFPPSTQGEETEVTGVGRITELRAWLWADGTMPLGETAPDKSADAVLTFELWARPVGWKRYPENEPADLRAERTRKKMEWKKANPFPADLDIYGSTDEQEE